MTRIAYVAVTEEYKNTMISTVKIQFRDTEFQNMQYLVVVPPRLNIQIVDYVSYKYNAFSCQKRQIVEASVITLFSTAIFRKKN